MSKPKQGEIILTSFDPVKGHEQSGYRPALVVSNAEKNQWTYRLKAQKQQAISCVNTFAQLTCKTGGIIRQVIFYQKKYCFK